MAKSISYTAHQIQFLKTPKSAAAYLAAILAEPDPEPTLLYTALCHVAEALSESPAQAAQRHTDLQELWHHPNSQWCDRLQTWLNTLNLQLTVTVQPQPENRAAPAFQPNGHRTQLTAIPSSPAE